MFNIVQKQNSHAFEVRLHLLEERLHNTLSRKNTIKEVSSRKTHVVVLELVGTKGDEAPHTKDQHKSIKHQNPLHNSREDRSSHAHSPTHVGTHSGKVQLKHPLSIRILESKILKSIEKSPKLSNYDRKGDPDEHVKLVNGQLSCFNTNDSSNCILFVLTL